MSTARTAAMTTIMTMPTTITVTAMAITIMPTIITGMVTTMIMIMIMITGTITNMARAAAAATITPMITPMPMPKRTHRPRRITTTIMSMGTIITPTITTMGTTMSMAPAAGMIIMTTLTTMPMPANGTAIGMADGGVRAAPLEAAPVGGAVDAAASGPDGTPRAASAGLLDLMVWLSPAFPVGGFTYSHGLEWAIEDGSVATAADLEAWLADVLRHGAGRNDAILFAAAWRAAAAGLENVGGDVATLAEIVELAAALQPTRERRLEASQQGAAFVKAVTDAWPHDAMAALVAALQARFGSVPWTYAVAVATASAAHGIALADALPATLQAFAANVISAGVRAIPLGQTDGLRILRRLGPVVAAVAAEGLAAGLDDLGGAAVRADIASMKHETQYTRLFRS
jgi:urease accessory protein